jgi:hypothetical protein
MPARAPYRVRTGRSRSLVVSTECAAGPLRIQAAAHPWSPASRTLGLAMPKNIEVRWPKGGAGCTDVFSGDEFTQHLVGAEASHSNCSLQGGKSEARGRPHSIAWTITSTSDAASCRGKCLHLHVAGAAPRPNPSLERPESGQRGEGGRGSKAEACCVTSDQARFAQQLITLHVSRRSAVATSHTSLTGVQPRDRAMSVSGTLALREHTAGFPAHVAVS